MRRAILDFIIRDDALREIDKNNKTIFDEIAFPFDCRLRRKQARRFDLKK